MDKHFVIFFKLDQWLRRKCHLKIFLELWQPFFQLSGTICAILVEGIEEQFCEIIVNLSQWFRCLKDFLSGALETLLFSGAEPFVQFQRGHHGEHACEVI